MTWTAAARFPCVRPVEPVASIVDEPVVAEHDEAGWPDPTPLAAFQPGQHTITEVLAYVDEHPDDLDRVLVAEIDGAHRTTLVGALQRRRDDLA
jgi:hypothetical protein